MIYQIDVMSGINCTIISKQLDILDAILSIFKVIVGYDKHVGMAGYSFFIVTNIRCNLP